MELADHTGFPVGEWRLIAVREVGSNGGLVHGFVSLSNKSPIKTVRYGGGGGIRTRDTVSRIHTFQACAFSRSATPPVALMIWALTSRIAPGEERTQAAWASRVPWTAAPALL